MAATSCSAATTACRQVQKLGGASTACRKRVRLLISWISSTAALLGVREKLSAHDQPAAPALERYFEFNYAPYYLRSRLLAAGVDAAGRRRLPGARAARLHPAR